MLSFCNRNLCYFLFSQKFARPAAAGAGRGPHRIHAIMYIDVNEMRSHKIKTFVEMMVFKPILGARGLAPKDTRGRHNGREGLPSPTRF